jgi:hypothetical protein
MAVPADLEKSRSELGDGQSPGVWGPPKTAKEIR